MFQARYTAKAIKAMVDTPQDREAAARPLIESVGGKLHHLFFSFGAEDIVALIEAPDDNAMAAGAMAVETPLEEEHRDAPGVSPRERLG